MTTGRVLTVKYGQRGSALMETLVLCIVLSPLALLVPMLGNVADLKQAAIQASRYVAWEQTVAPDLRSSAQVKSRFFDHPAAAIQSTQENSASGTAAQAGGLRLWHMVGAVADGQGRGDKLQVTFGDGAGYQLSAGNGQAQSARSAGQVVKAMGQPLTFLDNVQWDIESDGSVEAQVQVNLLSNRILDLHNAACSGSKLVGISGCVSARNSIMVDGWGVAQNTMAENRSRALVPSAVLQETGNSLSRMGAIPVFVELNGLKGAFGRVDSTQLPLDRYTGDYRRAE